MWHNKAMYKEKIEAMATKFSEKFAIIMLKKHRKFCRRGLTHLDATPNFINCANTYASQCMSLARKVSGTLVLHLKRRVVCAR